ncbi:MAG: hypothetical protein RSA68_18840 [Hafnia sp.]|nr:hypothetical protein [Hafnia alvei]STQ70509.1 Uncharacterised protein [Hafnia alvei]
MAIHPHHRITIGTKATVPITTVETMVIIMATAAITVVIIANLA